MYRTKNNCMHVQLDQILDPQNSERPKNQTDSFEEPGAKTECQEQKQGTTHAPCTQYQKGEGKPPKPPLYPPGVEFL